MGTLLRAGDQLRATTQLVEAPGGTLLTSHTIQSSLGDLFQLQDDIAKRRGGGARAAARRPDAPTPEAPHNARAYALYLRANELARSYGTVPAGARRCTSSASSSTRTSLPPGRSSAAAAA